ncbi:hypothetical protein LTR41_012042, partial [Exophiala xenobiotica]
QSGRLIYEIHSKQPPSAAQPLFITSTMAPNILSQCVPDAHFIVRVAGNKISRESARPDQDLLLLVGHANFRDRLNDVILDEQESQVYNRSNIKRIQPGSYAAKPESSISSVDGR